MVGGEQDFVQAGEYYVLRKLGFPIMFDLSTTEKKAKSKIHSMLITAKKE